MSSSLVAPGGPSPASNLACILIVEDELLIRILIGDELRDAGFHVIEACDADEALILLDKLRPDLIVSDVKMPGSLDGIQLLSIVKERAPDLPVVITSGHCDQATVEEQGADLFLRKPFSIPGLVTSVKRLLGLPL